MIMPYLEAKPRLGDVNYIAPSADIIGDVHLGAGCTVWFGATIRGDVAPISIGERTNIQDNAVVHVNSGVPTHIGNDVSIGHGAIIHGCTIGNGCLVGMGAIILDRAIIGEHSLVAAGALVSPRKVFPPRSLIVGSPAKVARTLTDDEIAGMQANADHYVGYGLTYANMATGNG